MTDFKIHSSTENNHILLSPTGMLHAALIHFGLYSAIYCAFFQKDPGDLWIFYLFGFLSIVIFSLVYNKHAFSLIVYIAVGFTFLLSIFLFDLPGGLCSLFNSISHTFGSHLSKNLTLFLCNDSSSVVALIWLSIILALGCIWIVSVRSSMIGWFILFLLLTVSLTVHIHFPMWTLLLYLAGLLLLRLPETMLTRFTKAGSLFWVLCLGICSLTILVSLRYLDAHSLPVISSLHTKITDLTQEYRYGETSSSGMPEGDFTNLGSLVQTDVPMLEITMNQPDSYYLRGFIGCEYDGNSWKAADPVTLYDGASLFYWLHQAAFYGTSQLSHIATLLDNDIASQEPVTMEIRHTGARTNHIYAPYELISADKLQDPDSIGDITLTYTGIKGLNQYHLTCTTNQVKRYATLSSMLKLANDKGASGELSEYLKLESHYNHFAYTHFCDVPEDLNQTLEDILGQVPKDGQSHVSYQSAKQTVLSWLNDNIQYAETIPERTIGKDFLKEFLTEKQAGYDVHYASAATMMMRYLGIPARYVEGYLITPDTAASAMADTPFTLTEEASHAWVEIYQDGIGWIPFEVTPKYLDVMEQDDNLYGTGAGEYHSSDSPNQDTPEENSLEMDDDYHDDPEDEAEEDEKPDVITPIIRFIVTISLIILLLLILIWIIRHFIRKLRKYFSFRDKNRKTAVIRLYSELHQLCGLLFHWSDCVMPSYFADNLRQGYGDDIAGAYKDVINICERAAFSDYDIMEDDYQLVYHYVKQIRKLTKKKLTLKEKFKAGIQGKL